MIRLATVMAVAPMTVRRDGDGIDIPVVETTVTCAIGDRVLTVNIDQSVYIIACLI